MLLRDRLAGVVRLAQSAGVGHDGGEAEMKRLLIAAASVVLLVGAASSAALAGEVKGPPNQVDNTNETGALDHANSACAASGLNDFDTTDPGQNSSQVQTAADAWNFYGFAPGATGTLGLCQGGTGEL
jgi:opacity protein-like surface antigen